MAASVYLQKVETMMEAWMTYSKANSRCTLAVRCSVCATVNCRNALSTACRAVRQLVCEHRDQTACVRRRLEGHASAELGNYFLRHNLSLLQPCSDSGSTPTSQSNAPSSVAFQAF